MTTAITTSYEGSTCVIALKSPPLNLVTVDLLKALDAAFEEARNDDRVACVLVTGDGDRAFCAGSDLNQTLALKESGRFIEDKLTYETNVLSSIAEFPKPVIAAIEGVAFGGGLEIASCCDLVFASTASRFALPEINIGGFPPTGVLRVGRLIGLSRLKQLVLLGKPIDAQTALSWGLCNQLFEPGQVSSGALEQAVTFERLPKRALQYTKRALEAVAGVDDRALLSGVLELSGALAKTKDGLAGARSFIAKMPPVFTDKINRQ